METKLRIVPGLWLCKGGYEAEVVGWSFTKNHWLGYCGIKGDWVLCGWGKDGTEFGVSGIYDLAELQVAR